MASKKHAILALQYIQIKIVNFWY